ncbi:MAG: hypothetical protein ACUVUE_06010, partial [Candidatus Bathycorpusculaceae bacterium]
YRRCNSAFAYSWKEIESAVEGVALKIRFGNSSQSRECGSHTRPQKLHGSIRRGVYTSCLFHALPAQKEVDIKQTLR